MRYINILKKTFILAYLLSLSVQVEAATKFGSPALEWIFENLILLIVVFGILMIAISMVSMDNDFTKIKQRKILASRGITLPEESSISQKSFWARLNKQAWQLVPVEKEIDIQLDHDYDGIKELDNSLPPWWLYLFYLTIAFGGVYIYVYHMSDIGLDQNEEYLAQMEVAKAQKLYSLSSDKDNVNENTVTFVNNEDDLAIGKNIFNLNCVACHGPDGQGTIGPNLTDEYWVHGGGISDIFKTIKYGVPEKGMISWKAQLRPASMQKVASYIMTLKGTNPPNPKDAEGTLYKEGVQ